MNIFFLIVFGKIVFLSLQIHFIHITIIYLFASQMLYLCWNNTHTAHIPEHQIFGPENIKGTIFTLNIGTAISWKKIICYVITLNSPKIWRSPLPVCLKSEWVADSVDHDQTRRSAQACLSQYER